MRALKFKKKTVVILAGLLTVVTAGGAFAYWTASGAGVGSGTTSAGASNLTVTQTVPITNLFPGDSPHAITGTVTNNAANSAYVTAVTVSISGVAGGAGACTAADYTLATPVMSVGVNVLTTASTGFTGATIKFNNTAANQDGCKGATVSLAYAAS